ncbi:TonB-dependent receptor [Acidicapsa acidisoli]|uniref:TonB-dependent receptor n=1 Tax=Acidicapsa acidisoli TaxID=1615681 RepID=UPI0021DFDFF3|nr:TonB-dependent receptor [Acidicapsa acidisoli]
MGNRSIAPAAWFLLPVFGLLALPGNGWSQTGEISVDTTDGSGAILVGVSVVVTDVDTGDVKSLTSDSAGLAVAPALPPGRYKVSGSINGFGTQEQTLTLTVGQVAAVRFAMKAATAPQTVEVLQNAGPEIEATSADVSSVVERQQLDQLPVINRGFIGLAQLSPGGAPSLPADARFGIQTAFGGANVRSGYSVLIDGADVDHPIYGIAIVDVDQDAVQEFRVNHNQYDAQYGRAGTAVVDAVTRSGTNSYAGMFTYFGQDQSLNARNFFVHTAQSPFTETITSATFGGPIIKDKMHFFASDEYLKQNSPVIESLPASNPFAATYNGVYTGLTDEKSVQAKLDMEKGARDNFSLRYLLEDQSIISSYSLYENYNPVLFHDGILSWAHVFSRSTINSGQLEYLDQNTTHYQTVSGPEIIRPSFTSGSAPNLPQGYPRHRGAFNDTLYSIKGRNSIKVGARMAYERLYQEANFYGSGVWTFNTNSPFVAGDPATYPIQYEAGSGPSTVLYRNAELSYFVQDNIELSGRLTLNAGVRYDAETNLRDDRFVNELIDNPQFSGVDNFVSKSRGNYLDGIQPRLGLAWDLTGKGRTILRAGFGGMVARNRPFFDAQMQAQDTNFEVIVTNPTLLAGYPSQTAVLGGISVEQYALQNGNRALYLVGDHLNIPYVYESSLGVEKALAKDTVLTVDGIRQIQTYLQTGHDANLPAVGPVSIHPRPLPRFGSVTSFNGTTSAYYSALDVQLKSRFKKASVLASYTWSKSISDGLDDNTSAISDPFHEYGNNDRGFDEEDRRSNLTVSPLVSLPWNFKLSSIVTLMTGTPWNITYGKDFDGDGNTQDRPAGLAKDIGGRGHSSDLAIINAARTSYQSATLPSGLVIPALNPSGCANPGSEPSGACFAPVTMAELNQHDGIKKIDVRFTKGFNMGERYRLELFWEMYDITNTPSFQAPNATISSPDFLERNTANNPRQMQYGARFIFGAH